MLVNVSIVEKNPENAYFLLFQKFLFPKKDYTLVILINTNLHKTKKE